VHGTYSYDSVGQRKRSVVTKAGVQTTTDFTYTGLTLHKLEATQAGGTAPENWTITYLYDEYGKPYAGVYRDGAASVPVVFGLVTTDRGDVVELLDADGSPFAAYRYDAWGNPLGAGTDGAVGMWWQTTALISDPNLAKAISERQVLRYAGYCYDQESGLYYLSARHYDPVSRQFLSKDLSRNDGEQSAYQYCGGNPVANVDPNGLSFLPSGMLDVLKKAGAVARAGRQAEEARLARTRANSGRLERFNSIVINNLPYGTPIEFPRTKNPTPDYTDAGNEVLRINGGHLYWKYGQYLKQNPGGWFGCSSPELSAWGGVVGYALTNSVTGQAWDVKRASPEVAAIGARYFNFHGEKISKEDFGNILVGSNAAVLKSGVTILRLGSQADAILEHRYETDEQKANEIRDQDMISWG
jgi:RHS repeat-associated protein